MADVRVVYVEQLGSDVLGNTVIIPSTDEPLVLIEVVHWLEDDIRRTTLRDSLRRAWTVPGDVLIRVLP